MPKRLIKPSRVQDNKGNVGNVVDEVKMILASGDSVQIENSRKAKALIVFGNGTLDFAVMNTPGGALQPVTVGSSFVVPVAAATANNAGVITPALSVELSVTPINAQRLCSRHFQVVFLDDFNPPDAPKGGSQDPGQDPEMIINP